MIKEIGEKLSKQLRIDITQVIREEWEMKILKVLFDSPIGNKIYFKGGTALRLAYGSPRFSEDLDFTQTKKITRKELDSLLIQIKKKYPQISISDFKDKFYTILIEFKISEDFLPRKFSIKIEISKRANKKFQSSLALLISPTINLQILAKVEKLKDLYKDKLITLNNRKQPRDLFDLWYICQKLKIILPDNLPKISKREIKQELNKFLPVMYQKLVEQLKDQYGK